mmetsp:Transcript_19136/g.51170  ORF Transcript_19136/g.51170 Transcript_19136/m.51170 type:complete len:214 (-) Transcript_19136:114-755(-)
MRFPLRSAIVRVSRHPGLMHAFTHFNLLPFCRHHLLLSLRQFALGRASRRQILASAKLLSSASRMRFSARRTRLCGMVPRGCRRCPTLSTGCRQFPKLAMFNGADCSQHSFNLLVSSLRHGTRRWWSSDQLRCLLFFVADLRHCDDLALFAMCDLLTPLSFLSRSITWRANISHEFKVLRNLQEADSLHQASCPFSDFCRSRVGHHCLFADFL